jgi:hypothetical protein
MVGVLVAEIAASFFWSAPRRGRGFYRDITRKRKKNGEKNGKTQALRALFLLLLSEIAAFSSCLFVCIPKGGASS